VRCAAGLVVLIVASPAFAEEPIIDGGGEVKQQPHAPYRVNMRLGTASTDRNGAPTICAEVRVWADLAVESCGTGADILHNNDGPEMMHVRGTYEIWDRTTARGRGGIRLGAGFAEMSVGDDKIGFEFGDPDARDPVSVAGPEASVSAQWTVPLGKKLEAVGTFTGGVGYFSGARKLVLPRDELQPFASFELGVGW
jgi:hypothetical protein